VPSVEQHQAAVRALLAPLGSRAPELWTADGPPAGATARVLADDLFTTIDLPPFDNSQMDGYAVRAADVKPGEPLAVAPRIPAGHGYQRLEDAHAAPIMTGAAVPLGADAIIPIESATPPEFLPPESHASVSFAKPVEAGAFVRRRGSDLPAGSLLLGAGTNLGAAQWGVIAASGITRVPLLSRIRVLVLSTGNELVSRGGPLGDGQIYDANGTSLAVALPGAGCEVVDVCVESDDVQSVRTLIAERGPGVDLIVTTGGVSAGAYEVVRDVFEGTGVTFVSIAMQPGGPQGLGETRIGERMVPVVALPGNPVSVLVSFEMFLRPVLRSLHGLAADRRAWRMPLAARLESPEGKHQVRRGRISRTGEVELVGGPSSHLLHSYAASTVLVHVPVGVVSLDAGDEVEVWSIDD
jgi:molybdopterin molybdotransferase